MKQYKFESVEFNMTEAMESVPLAMEHKEALCVFNTDLNIIWSDYQKMSDAGALECFSARLNGEMVGYAIYIVNHHTHYADLLVAYQDVIFMREGHRGYSGIKFLLFIEKRLKERGVNAIIQTSKTSFDLGRIYERMGYAPIEKLFAKEI